MVGFPSTCAECLERVDEQSRQALGCPYAPEPDQTFRLHVETWTGCGVEPRPATDDAPAFPSVCPGFTTTLPETIEAARAHLHWTKGELTQFCRGYASEALLIGIEVLSTSSGETMSWIAENPRKKAGQ